MFIVELILFAVIIVLDIVSKYWIVKTLGVLNGVQTKSDITVIKNVVSFSYGENTGASFGIFKGRTTALIVVTAIALFVLIVYLFLSKKQNKFMRICFIMILGGGLGNLYDRIFIGYVRDFIKLDFFKFPVFNVADSFITIGTVMLCVYILFFSSSKNIATTEKADVINKSPSYTKCNENMPLAEKDNEGKATLVDDDKCIIADNNSLNDEIISNCENKQITQVIDAENK